MPAQIHDAVLGDLTLKQCSAADYSPNAKISRARASGAINASELFHDGSEPRFRWTTSDIAGAFASSVGLSPNTGKSINNATINVPFAEREISGIASGTSHFRLGASYGLVIPMSLSASQGEEKASLELELAAYSTNGLVHPVAMVDNASLSAAAFNVEHRLGPAYINDVKIPDLLRMQINFGIVMSLNTYNGENYPTRVQIDTVDPTIDLFFHNVKLLKEYTDGIGTMTGATVYLRKRKPGGSVVADDVAEHIGFSFAGGIQEYTTIQASGNGLAEPGIRLHGKTLTVSVATALPSEEEPEET